jgi:hypothetical protein
LAGRTCAVASDCRSGLCGATSELCQPGEVESFFYAERTDQDIHIYLQVKNVTASTINLSDYVLRYYFSHEPSEPGQEPQVFDNRNCTVTLVDEERQQGGFPLWHALIAPSDIAIAPNATSPTLDFRIYANVPAPAYMDETNDYSWGPQTEFTEEPWLTIPAWRGSAVVFGIPAP